MPGRMAPEPAVAGRPPMVSPPRLVGRERELAALGATFAGGPAVVLIEGEAGIGKSRLLTEFLGSHAGKISHEVVATCPPFRQPQTLGPLADALRQAVGDVPGLGLTALAGVLRPLFPEWAADLPPLPDPAEDASAARHRVFAALAEMISRLGPGLLAVEDAQWADEATLEFLLYLAARQPQPVSLVLSYRPEDVPPGSPLLRLASRRVPGRASLRLALGPLDVAATGGLVSSMLTGERVSVEFATFVRLHTDGVPLAIEESVRLMADRADIVYRGGEWVRRQLTEIAVPPTVRDAVLERAERLGAVAQTVLRAAAVLADPASEAVLVVVTGLEPGNLRAGLSAALEARRRVHLAGRV
jgi:predicted ATPase